MAVGYKIHAGVNAQGNISFTLSERTSDLRGNTHKPLRALKKQAHIPNIPEFLSLVGMYCDVLDLAKYNHDFETELA